MPPENASASDRAEAVGAIIRQRREDRGISLRTFAKQCQMSPAHVSKIERGLSSPSLLVLTRIVRELDLHDADLFGGDVQAPGGAQVVRAAEASSLPEHFPAHTVSSRHAIAIVLAGTAEAQVSDEVFALQEGDTLIVPPLAPHAIRSTDGDSTRTHYISAPGS